MTKIFVEIKDEKFFVDDVQNAPSSLSSKTKKETKRKLTI